MSSDEAADTLHWYLGRGGVQAGPFTEAQVRSWHEGGQLLGDDLVWCDGWTEWRPASEVFAATVQPPPLPPPIPAQSVPAPPAVPIDTPSVALPVATAVADAATPPPVASAAPATAVAPPVPEAAPEAGEGKASLRRVLARGVAAASVLAVLGAGIVLVPGYLETRRASAELEKLYDLAEPGLDPAVLHKARSDAKAALTHWHPDSEGGAAPRPAGVTSIGDKVPTCFMESSESKAKEKECYYVVGLGKQTSEAGNAVRRDESMIGFHLKDARVVAAYWLDSGGNVVRKKDGPVAGAGSTGSTASTVGSPGAAAGKPQDVAGSEISPEQMVEDCTTADDAAEATLGAEGAPRVHPQTAVDHCLERLDALASAAQGPELQRRLFLTHLKLGLANDMLNRTEPTLENYAQALTHAGDLFENRGRARVHLARGMHYLRREMFQNAVDDLKAAHEIGGASAELANAYMLFGRSEATNGKYAEAYAIFDSGLEVAPFRTHKGEFLMQKGSAKCTQAASGTAEARASLTSEGGALFEKAIAELEQARGEDAERAAIPGGLATITEALARAHYGRGRCRAAIGEISEAEAEFKTAVELVGAESVLGKKIQAVIASLAAVKR